jgi:GT2 family glycosyltransferase
MGSAADKRLLIISPVRNEAAHIERVAAALAAQTRPPDRWIVVDDGSSDATPEILDRLSTELKFMEVVATPPGFTREANDRLAVAAAPRAFNYGLATVDISMFSHIGKLDGDVELRPNYYEVMFEEFEFDPTLGIAGGLILEINRGEWQVVPNVSQHVRGALKLYTRECFEAIGGIVPRLGWDGIDSTLARMKGYRTSSFDRAQAFHHRHTASADGRIRGHVRWGEAHWTLHHGVLWTLARIGKVGRQRPRGVSGIAYLYGYTRAALRRLPRLDVEGYRSFVRAEQRDRILRRLRVHPHPCRSRVVPGR